MFDYSQQTRPMEVTSPNSAADVLQTHGETVPYLNSVVQSVCLSVAGRLSTFFDQSATDCTPVAKRSKQTAGLDPKQ